MNQLIRFLLATFVAALLLGGRAEAQTTYTWANSNVAGTPVSLLDWFTGGANPQGSWTSGPPVSGNTNTIQFFENTTTALTNTALPSSQAVNLNNGGSAFELGTLTLSGLGSATTSANLTMTLSGDALNFSALTGALNLNALNATRTITYNVNNNIQLGTASSASVLTVGGAGTGTFVLGGIISELQSGGGSLIKNGTSAVSLTGANTFSNGVTLNAGTLRVGNAAALGTGTFAIAGGTLDATSAVTLNNNVQSWSGNFTFTGSNALNLGTGAVSLGAATRTVTVSASTLTVGGVISGGGAAVGLTKAGVGTLALNAANTYTGVTTVTAGVLLLNNANALPGGIGSTGGTSGLTFSDGTGLTGGVVGLTSDFSRSIGTGASQVQWTASGGGWAAFGADRTVNLGGNATPSTIVWGNTIANGGFNSQALTLGAANATHTIELANGLDLGTAERKFYVNDGAALFDAKLSGTIVGSGTLWIQGGGYLITGSNTHSGGTIVYRGTAFIDNANALGTGPVSIYSANSALASTAPTPLTLTNSIRPISWSSQTFSLGHANATGDLILAGGMVASGAFSGSAITLAGLSSVDISGPISGDATSVGFNFSVPSGRTLRLSGNIVGGSTGFNLTIGGAGLTVVSGTNTYTGTTTLSGGRLDLNSGTAISTGPLVIANATTLGNTSGAAITLSSNNAQTWNGNFTFAGSNDLNLGTGAVSLGVATRTVTVSSNTLTVGGAIGGNAAVGLTKLGAGTLSLGGANTYTGATSATGGGLVLDYGTQDNSKLSDTTSLTLSGVGVVLKGGSHTETVLSTALTAGGTVISRNGGTSVARLNAVTRSARGTLVFGEASIATTDTLNVNSILGGWATIGNDWAINSTNAADGAITALASYTGALPTATGASTANYTLTGDQTQAGAVAANTLKITNTGNSETLSLAGNNLTITAASATSLGGILYAGGGDGNYTIASTTGRIHPSTANQELIFQTTSGMLTVDALVGANNASSVVTKSGSGTLVLGAANNFTGAVRVNQGALRLTNATGAGTTAGGIAVQNGAALELANAITVGAEALTLNGSGISNAGALRNLSGTNTYGGLVTLGADSRINSDPGTLNLTNVGTITGSGLGLTIGGAGNTSISSIIGTVAGTLTKDGAGTLRLTAANTYTGSTTVSAGTLFVNGSLAAGSAVSVGVSGSLGGTGTISGATTILGAHTPGVSPGIQTFASHLTYSGGSSSVQWELSGNTITNVANPNAVYDQILVGGNLNFAAATSLSLLFNGAGSSVLWADPFWDAPQQWTLYDVNGSTTGFGNLSLAPGSYLDSGSNSLASARSSASFSLVQSGNDVVVSYVAVPEPGGVALVGLGLAAAAFAYRRRGIRPRCAGTDRQRRGVGALPAVALAPGGVREDRLAVTNELIGICGVRLHKPHLSPPSSGPVVTPAKNTGFGWGGEAIGRQRKLPYRLVGGNTQVATPSQHQETRE